MSALALNQHTPADATSGAISLTLPTTAISGDEISVEKIDATANTVTLTGNIRSVAAQSIVLTLTKETICLRADAAGSWWPVAGHKTLASLDDRFTLGLVSRSDLLAAGELVPRRELVISNAAGGGASSGIMYLTYFTAARSETVSTLTAWTGTVAAAATPTLCRMGLYSVDASGNITLVASTPNDTTLFAATNTGYPKALSASYAKVVGQRYATGLLVVTGAALPTFHGVVFPATGVINAIGLLAPARQSRIGSQADLPATVAVGSLVGSQLQIAMQLS